MFPVCGNTWKMLHHTRFGAHFDFIGNGDIHYGIFAGCGTAIPYDNRVQPPPAASACC